MLLTRTGLQSVRATKVLNRSFSCSAVAMRDITKEIEAQIRSKKCVVYMRGDTALPQCKFSKAVVDALRSVDADYQTYDVLQDEELREEIKKFANWPSIPLVYINGQFVGGCDMLLTYHMDGELRNMVKE